MTIYNKAQRALDFLSFIKRRYYYRDLPESVYFYTFHKCASTLFSDYILKNMNGLQHIDYAAQLYSSERGDEKIIFRDRGEVYGPIRLSASPMTPVYKMLVVPATRREFIQDKIAIFFVRDPRDILVSAYYSYGYTHNFSPVKELKKQQEIRRDRIQAMSLDEYVLDSADEQSKNFNYLKETSEACERSVILKYEDMINEFDYFVARLCKYVAIDDDVIQVIYEKSRPKSKEDVSSHRRSGHVGSFRHKLKEQTIDALNRKLEDVLKLFEYEV